MLAEILENLLISFANNWKKYLGCFIGFVLGVLLVEYGVPKTVFIIILSIAGYKMGDMAFIKRMKRFILEKIKED